MQLSPTTSIWEPIEKDFALDLLEQQHLDVQIQSDVTLAPTEIYRALDSESRIEMGVRVDTPEVEVLQSTPVVLEKIPPLVPSIAETLR